QQLPERRRRPGTPSVYGGHFIEWAVAAISCQLPAVSVMSQNQSLFGIWPKDTNTSEHSLFCPFGQSAAGT
ncbi:MAG: hypothetical protein WKF70_11465, partial [Chitinophagaceae bacterium]